MSNLPNSNTKCQISNVMPKKEGGNINLGIKTSKQQGAKKYLGKGIVDHWGVAKHDEQQYIREQRNTKK
jgi:hypothetical protein